MSWLVQYRALARYNQWMNEKLYACAATLGDDARKEDRGAFFRSIHGTFNHLLLADSIWMQRFTGDSRHLPRDAQGEPIQIASLAQELYADFAVLRQRRAAMDTEIIAFTEALDEAALERPIRYATSRGDTCEHPLWPALSHVFNHQTHHRGQITTLLTQAGLDPGVTDFIAYMRSA